MRQFEMIRSRGEDRQGETTNKGSVRGGGSCREEVRKKEKAGGGRKKRTNKRR